MESFKKTIHVYKFLFCDQYREQMQRILVLSLTVVHWRGKKSSYTC